MITATWDAGYSSTASDEFRFDSDAASSTQSIDSTSGDSDAHLEDWRTTTKVWSNANWAVVADRFLFRHGFALHLRGDFCGTASLQSNEDVFFAERAAALEDDFMYCCIRRAHDLNHPYTRSVYVRAVLQDPESNEVAVTKLLTQFHDNPANCAVRTVKVLEHEHDGLNIAFLVQEDAGQPCFEFTHNVFKDEILWRTFVLSCFEGLSFLHSLGIAHLDIGPMNVLYDACKHRPSFIDFEGCHTIAASESFQFTSPEAASMQATTTKIGRRKLSGAINARLPESHDPDFDVFAADVWCLGAMLRDMREFPDDDLRALFRFMCMREPRARPSMAYATERLKALLASETDLLY